MPYKNPEKQREFDRIRKQERRRKQDQGVPEPSAGDAEGLGGLPPPVPAAISIPEPEKPHCYQAFSFCSYPDCSECPRTPTKEVVEIPEPEPEPEPIIKVPDVSDRITALFLAGKTPSACINDPKGFCYIDLLYPAPFRKPGYRVYCAWGPQDCRYHIGKGTGKITPTGPLQVHYGKKRGFG